MKKNKKNIVLYVIFGILIIILLGVIIKLVLTIHPILTPHQKAKNKLIEHFKTDNELNWTCSSYECKTDGYINASKKYSTLEENMDEEELYYSEGYYFSFQNMELKYLKARDSLNSTNCTYNLLTNIVKCYDEYYFSKTIFTTKSVYDYNNGTSSCEKNSSDLSINNNTCIANTYTDKVKEYFDTILMQESIDKEVLINK